MTIHRLAVPIASFVLLSAIIPSRAQNFTDRPPAQLASNVGPQTTPALSEEEMARLLLVRKQYTEAQAIFQHLTVEQPKNAVYWNELGISLHSQSLLGPALKCYTKSAKLDSHYADALNNAGTIWYERKQYERRYALTARLFEKRLRAVLPKPWLRIF